MKTHDKKQEKQERIFIPTLGEIPIGAGTVPSSGATVSIEKLNKEFNQAVRDKIISPPPVGTA